MAQGWYAPEPVPTALRTQSGLPVQLGVTRYEREGNRIHAVLTSEGVDLIDATITLKEGPRQPTNSREEPRKAIPLRQTGFSIISHPAAISLAHMASSSTAFPSQARSRPVPR